MARARDNYPLVEVVDRAEWRRWLESNHATSRGVWLAIGRKGNTRTALTYDEAVEEALCFGWIDSVMNPLDDQRFKQLLTPRKPGGTWSASNKIRVERLTAEGLMTPAGLAAIDAARANGSWTILNEVDALVVPSDLLAALAADPAAAANFEAFPASARRAFLWWIISTKRPETRAKRVAETARMAAENRRLGEANVGSGGST